MKFVRIEESTWINGNYERLYQLALEQSIVCIVDGPMEGSRDVAQTLTPLGGLAVSCRGMCYIQAQDRADFLKQCEQYNLAWMHPFGCKRCLKG